MAEAVFKQLNAAHEVLSAGTRVKSKEGESRHGQLLKDLPAADNVIIPLRDIGIEVAENVRTQLGPEMVEWADIIVSMAEPETVPDYLAASPKMIYWEIKDPKGTPLEEHREIMNQIKRKLETFIEEYKL